MDVLLLCHSELLSYSLVFMLFKSMQNTEINVEVEQNIQLIYRLKLWIITVSHFTVLYNLNMKSIN